MKPLNSHIEISSLHHLWRTTITTIYLSFLRESIFSTHTFWEPYNLLYWNGMFLTWSLTLYVCDFSVYELGNLYGCVGRFLCFQRQVDMLLWWAFRLVKITTSVLTSSIYPYIFIILLMEKKHKFIKKYI